MYRLIYCGVFGLWQFCIPAIATDVVLNTGPTKCGLELIGQEPCPQIDNVPCTTVCEVKIAAEPGDPLGGDEWGCWNADNYEWQSQATEPTNSTAVVNKFSVAPPGAGKKLTPPANGGSVVVCANFFSCGCVAGPTGGYSCSKGSTTGRSVLLRLVRSTDACPVEVGGGPQ